MTYRLTVVTEARQFGGAEQVLVTMVAALPADVVVHVLATSPAIGNRIVASRPGSALDPLPSGLAATRQALAATHPDVVLVNLPSFTSARTAWLACLTLGLPTLLIDHAPTDGLTWRGRAVQRALTRGNVTRVAVGRRTAAQVEEWGGLPRGSVRWIRNGVPPLSVQPRPDRSVLGFLGRLDPVKAVDVLLEACAGLPDVELRIAGEGPIGAELRQLAESLGIADRVSFVGFQDPERFLATIDVLVLPSRSEGLPLVLLEAMFAGVPVVATTVGAIPEVITDGETGLLVPPGDVPALRDALRAMFDDPQRRASMARAARARGLEEFSSEEMANRYDAVLRAMARR